MSDTIEETLGKKALELFLLREELLNSDFNADDYDEHYGAVIMSKPHDCWDIWVSIWREDNLILDMPNYDESCFIRDISKGKAMKLLNSSLNNLIKDIKRELEPVRAKRKEIEESKITVEEFLERKRKIMDSMSEFEKEQHLEPWQWEQAFKDKL